MNRKDFTDTRYSMEYEKKYREAAAELAEMKAEKSANDQLVRNLADQQAERREQDNIDAAAWLDD